MAEKQALNAEDVMEILKVSKNKAYELIHSKDGPPAIRFGRCIRIPRDGFEAWLREQSEQRTGL